MLKDLTTIEIDTKMVHSRFLDDYLIPSSLKAILESCLDANKYTYNSYTSSAVTDPKKNQVAIIPNQYFVLACEMFELATELFKYIEVFDELRKNGPLLLGTAEEIKDKLAQESDLPAILNDESNIDLFTKFLDKKNSTYRLNAKNFISKDGVARPSNDCFSSVILSCINLQNASSGIFGFIVYELSKQENKFRDVRAGYISSIQNKNSPSDIKQNVFETSTTNLSKPFILLAGISGTGKTRFVREQAQRGADRFGLEEGENYCLVPVRPDWHEPSDLFGYISRLNGVQYVATDFLKFVFKALSAAIFDIEDSRIIWKDSEHIPPFWLCLDEMNLAPVEQYFADYLSIIETRKWSGDTYESEALLTKGAFDALLSANSVGGNAEEDTESPIDAFFHEIFSGITIPDKLERKLTKYITEKGLLLPPNLIVAGTVNMDETTHGFSRKVIDRALTFDFGEFFPNDFDTFFVPKSEPVLLSFPVNSQATKTALSKVPSDSDGEKSITFLKAINEVLTGTPFELAYRALNELLLSVVSFTPSDDKELQAVWDDFMMCKVLPRIDGDSDKLAVVNTSGAGDTILDQLETKLQEQLSYIWGGPKSRPDLLRESKKDGEPISIGCRSKKKLGWMKARLKKNTFTSFWP